MKKTASKKNFEVGSDTADEFFSRSLARARKLDRGERLVPELRITFEDPADLVRVLSAERVRLLQTIRDEARPVTTLAAVLKRDRRAVGRDVQLLESFGLVTVQDRINPGHGRVKVVHPLATRYRLSANI